MEDLAVFTALNGLENAAPAYGLGQYFQELGHSFSPYGPPSRQVTYIHLKKKNTAALTLNIPAIN